MKLKWNIFSNTSIISDAILKHILFVVLNHCGLITVPEIWVHFGAGNGFLPDAPYHYVDASNLISRILPFCQFWNFTHKVQEGKIPVQTWILSKYVASFNMVRIQTDPLFTVSSLSLFHRRYCVIFFFSFLATETNFKLCLLFGIPIFRIRISWCDMYPFNSFACNR